MYNLQHNFLLDKIDVSKILNLVVANSLFTDRAVTFTVLYIHRASEYGRDLQKCAYRLGPCEYIFGNTALFHRQNAAKMQHLSDG